jgi:hypothetical protein
MIDLIGIHDEVSIYLLMLRIPLGLINLAPNTPVKVAKSDNAQFENAQYQTDSTCRQMPCAPEPL